MSAPISSDKQLIGVLGAAGQLGFELIRMLVQSGAHVAAGDIRVSGSFELEELLKICDIVHICVPLDLLKGRFSVRKSTLVVLHDSVMSQSKHTAVNQFNRHAITVHMLMNHRKMVVIDETHESRNRVIRHFEQLGCNTTLLSVDTHDRVMARSQAPLALLLRLLHNDLLLWQCAGLLTPSAEDLLLVLTKRQEVWTTTTIDSLLKNRQVMQLIDEFYKFAAKTNK